jgi:hypothetical protein
MRLPLYWVTLWSTAFLVQSSARIVERPAAGQTRDSVRVLRLFTDAAAQTHDQALKIGPVPTTRHRQQTETLAALPRTPDGHPDLQGVWTYDTFTPLERPKLFEDKGFFTEAEEAAFQKAVRDGIAALLGEENVKTSGDVGFGEFGKLLADRRTALIIDPANGRLPPLLAHAQRQVESSGGRRKADGPEDFDASERCLTWDSPPMLPPPSNAHVQLVQTPDHVAIFTETFSEARVVPLNARPHLPSTILRWKGDSRGRWEGDTLIVDTTNLRPKRIYANLDRFKGTDDALHVIERFTLISADTIAYRFTVDDPTAYTAAWTAELPLVRTNERLFEYACHEGNYSLELSLRGARAEERRTKPEPPK